MKNFSVNCDTFWNYPTEGLFNVQKYKKQIINSIAKLCKILPSQINIKGKENLEEVESLEEIEEKKS